MTRAGSDTPWEGKWKAHDDARRADENKESGGDPHAAPRGAILRVPAGKAWLLRWAWLISTGTLILGAVLIVIILAGEGHRIGI